MSAHVSVLAASLFPLQLFGTPFLWPFAVVSPLTVFGANSNLSSNSITLLFGLNAQPHPAPQIRRVSRWHCAVCKFTYLLTYKSTYIDDRCTIWSLFGTHPTFAHSALCFTKNCLGNKSSSVLSSILFQIRHPHSRRSPVSVIWT